MAETPLIILVGTMSGTAELVADHVLRKLTGDGIPARIVRMEKAALAMFATRKQFLICSSTTGRGDVPDNARPFYDSLVTQRPVLSDVTYGVIGLGDSRFKRTFNGGGARFDAIFAELGARRIGERMKHDCRTNVAPEAMALAWLDEWLITYREAAGEHA
ncbi:MAG: flavodoxin family protein [Bradyrhizobium sp.]|nr:flavodoxin family protein [Bradyrhizobium sp.]